MTGYLFVMPLAPFQILTGFLKQASGFLEEALADRVFLAVAQFGKLLQLGLLCRGQMGRDFDIDPHVKIAVAIALDVFDALAFEAEHRSRLCASRHFDRGIAIEGRHFNLGSKGSLNEVYGNLAKDVVAISLENLMRLNMKHDV